MRSTSPCNPPLRSWSLCRHHELGATAFGICDYDEEIIPHSEYPRNVHQCMLCNISRTYVACLRPLAYYQRNSPTGYVTLVATFLGVLLLATVPTAQRFVPPIMVMHLAQTNWLSMRLHRATTAGHLTT